jgi:hypothetical protein
MGFSDQYYQRGLREGTAKRAGLSIEVNSMWGGNGFGTETMHTAYLGGEVVGEWTRSRIVGNYAFDKRDAVVYSYKAWRAALEEGAAARVGGAKSRSG